MPKLAKDCDSCKGPFESPIGPCHLCPKGHQKVAPLRRWSNKVEKHRGYMCEDCRKECASFFEYVKIARE